MAVANKPGGTSFNPLLIFGGVGLGKTHLAHAIGVEIKDKYPEKTVLYISAEIFTQQYIDSVKKNNRNDFIHFYQLIDVLIIDDVQFLSGKSGTQDVFFHIFNYLHQNGKQVILLQIKHLLTCKILNNVCYLVSNGDCLPNYTNPITKQEFQS
jgi:chromosomal replication initiator protein